MSNLKTSFLFVSAFSFAYICVKYFSRMKYYLIAGEASGDLHAAHLMRALRERDPQAQFRFWGGDAMQQVGGTLVRHYREMAYMGFVQVALHLGQVLRNITLCKNDLAAYRPDVLILVDYPGFNLKIARYAKETLHLPVHYYISPKIWAWKEHRIVAIKRYVDHIYSILPFEVDFYRRHDYAVDYVGNPTVDELSLRRDADETFAHFMVENHLSDKPIIALLPGSRLAEIKDNLRIMIAAAAAFPDYQMVIAGAPGVPPSFYDPYRSDRRVSVVFGKTYRLLQQARAALVTSGTATLETALLRVPQVVGYYMRGGQFTYALFRPLIKVDYVSLVNLIADAPVVPELLVHHFSPEEARRCLAPLLDDTPERAAMLRGYDDVVARLGEPGAPERAARLIVERLAAGGR